MGERINRIEQEFVLKTLVERGTPVTLYCRDERVSARLVELGDPLAIAPSRPVQWRPGDRAEVSFAFQNINHTFSSRVLALEPARIRLEMPDAVYRSLQRQFDRVRRPPGFDVSFRIAGVGSFDLLFPVSGGTSGGTHGVPTESPPPEASFDPAAIKDLVDDFNAHARTEGCEGRIVMMRNRVAGTYEERILQATGKALWIPSTDDDLPSRDPRPEPSILTKTDVVHYERDAGADPSIIVSRLADMLYRKKREGVASELYWPLLHGRFFVGYLSLLTREGAQRIAPALLEWVGQFARVLVFSLQRSGYFEGDAPQARPYHAEAVDLSASGLLFAHPEKDLYKKLLVHSDIQVSLNSRSRKMTVGGRVVRKFVDRERVYFALRFLEITPEDFRYLHETLYGRPFDPENVVSETIAPPGLTAG